MLSSTVCISRSSKYPWTAAIHILRIAAIQTTILILHSSPIFSQPLYKEIEVTNGGSVIGVVRLKGDPSVAEQITCTQNSNVCGTTKPSCRLSVGKNAGVANTIIFLDGITQGKKKSDSTLYLLNQQNCEYAPHIMIMPVGARLEIVNNDPILHNVHTYTEDKESRSLFNIAQPIKGLHLKPRPFTKPGLLSATCDAGHPWMSAHIMVADHPYYTVTDKDGKFTLDKIPPGNYTLRLWHEGVTIKNKVLEGTKVTKYQFEEPYEASRQVAVEANGKTNVEFELSLH
jgi:hypothetical protein